MSITQNFVIPLHRAFWENLFQNQREEEQSVEPKSAPHTRSQCNSMVCCNPTISNLREEYRFVPLRDWRGLCLACFRFHKLFVSPGQYNQQKDYHQNRVLLLQTEKVIGISRLQDSSGIHNLSSTAKDAADVSGKKQIPRKVTAHRGVISHAKLGMKSSAFGNKYFRLQMSLCLYLSRRQQSLIIP